MSKSLSLPIRGMTTQNITQMYHPGHPALDIVAFSKPYAINGYGTPLCAMEDVQVTAIRGDTYTPDDTSNLNRGYGIYLKGLETGHSYLYWHTLPVLPVNEGDFVERGKIVAFMGNAGTVYSGGVYVPLEKRTYPPYPGTHLHLEMFTPEWEYGDSKEFVNPFDYMNFELQPTYTPLSHVGKIAVVARKTLRLL